ncbi:putative HTH-type transcriptional regulator [BD1-7 clade bacterium]|uniref:Putative HTH-type transcriptional regulator n=1 Tax=BD1-7 clade bacterium TaxID=2029982 RepID=A0A5S9QPY3_9GAMM|nr:putative HTH-type transcriptional regulator [BD1-7 clade bacterium]
MQKTPASTLSNTSAPTSNYVSGSYVSATRNFALENMINLQLLIDGSELTMADLLDPPKHITETAYCTMIINLLNALDDPFASAIAFGHSFVLSSHGNLGLAAQGAATLYEAAELLCVFLKTRSSLMEASIVRDDARTNLRLMIRSAEGVDPAEMDRLCRFMMLSVMINLHKLIGQLLNEPREGEPMVIHLAYSEPEAFPYQLLSDTCEVVFDQDHFEMSMDSIWESWQLNAANKDVAEIAKAHCEAELRELQHSALDERIRQQLVKQISRNPTIEQMAELFNMSASTLQRKLKKYGTSYQTLKSSVRIDLAGQRLTTTDDAIDSIAADLGFSDLSNFSKSFKTATGVTPAAWRQQHRNT